MNDIYDRLVERYGEVSVEKGSGKQESPLEHAIRVRSDIRKKKYGTARKTTDIEVIQQDIAKIDHDLRLKSDDGFSLKKLVLNLTNKAPQPNYTNEELNDRIYETFSSFSDYLNYQLDLNKTTHEELSKETQDIQRRQVRLMRQGETLDLKLSEVTGLLSESAQELEKYSGQDLTADDVERRMVMKQYFDNLVREQDEIISDILNNYDMIQNVDETLLVLDFYKKVNNMVNVGQRAALGEARIITEQYQRDRNILSRIEENAEFAMQVYKTVDVIRGHVRDNFMQSKDKIDQLKRQYDQQIAQKRRDTALLKSERLSMMQGIDDSLMRRAKRYEEQERH